jgi:hypothetical protein
MGLTCGQLKKRPLATPTTTIRRTRRWTVPRWLGFGSIGAGYRIRTKRGVEMEREGQDTERDPIGGGQGGTQGGQ